MCQLYVKVSQTLVDQMMDSLCRPMLEQIVNTMGRMGSCFIQSQHRHSFRPKGGSPLIMARWGTSGYFWEAVAFGRRLLLGGGGCFWEAAVTFG